MRKLMLAGTTALLIALAGCSSTGGGLTLTGAVTEVGNEYGNLDTSITKAEVVEAGMNEGDMLEFSCGDGSFDVAYATTYGDVAEGEWVAFINWDDKLRFARNLANAAETANCKLDDLVTVSLAR